MKFWKKKTRKQVTLQEQFAQALDVFTKARDGLNNLAENIAIALSNKEQQIQRLQQEREADSDLLAKTNKTIKNIDNILG